jgi:hypothetical protein
MRLADSDKICEGGISDRQPGQHCMAYYLYDKRPTSAELASDPGFFHSKIPIDSK